MSEAAIRKFTFDTVFTEDGRVLRASDDERTSFLPEEMAEAKKKAFEEGERSAVAAAERASAAALETIATQLGAISSQVADACSSLRRDAVELGLAGARAAAETALTQYPEETLVSLMRECAESLREAPFVVVRAPEPSLEVVAERIQAAATDAGLAGAVRVEPGAGAPRLEWSAGAASVDAESALARAREAAERWLQVEDASQMNLFAET